MAVSSVKRCNIRDKVHRRLTRLLAWPFFTSRTA